MQINASDCQVRERRKGLGLTQMQLAVRAETHPAHISRIENGHRPSLDTAQKLAVALGATVDDLFPITNAA